MSGDLVAVIELKARMRADVASGGIRWHWDRGSESNMIKDVVGGWCTRCG